MVATLSNGRRLGPMEHGLRMSYSDFLNARYEMGYSYELIHGGLYVSPLSNLPEFYSVNWIYKNVERYSEKRPDVLNCVLPGGRVFIPGQEATTIPEPDMTAYTDYPLDIPLDEMDWEKVRPILVGEVVSPNDPHKDLIRNVPLYLQVPSIKEYWVLDGRKDPNKPRLRVHRRSRNKWKIMDLEHGEIYKTRMLPGFELIIDPRQ